jgi:hypothetical protein
LHQVRQNVPRSLVRQALRDCRVGEEELYVGKSGVLE